MTPHPDGTPTEAEWLEGRYRDAQDEHESRTPHPEQGKRWLVVFRNGDAVWSQHVVGSYRDADDYAASLCYEQATRYTIKQDRSR